MKPNPRRLGSPDFADDPDLLPYRRTEADVVDTTRDAFLSRVARRVPAVLDSLADLPAAIEPDQFGRPTPIPAALTAWATRWGLTAAWCLDYARPTWRELQARPSWRRWATPDGAGAFVESDDLRHASARRRLKDGRHLDWIVDFAVARESYAEISARYSKEIGQQGTEPQVVHEAVRTAARLIGLPLRAVRPGRPRKPAGPTS